jgi:preprotein translocase subunit SecG
MENTPQNNDSVPNAPAQAPVATAQPVPTSAPNKSIKLPIILMVWPAITIITVIILYAIANFLFSSTAAPDPSSESLFGDQGNSNPLRTITNVILFLFGAAAMAIGPLSFIAGIILLVIRLKK